jgi:hypothetical protein
MRVTSMTASKFCFSLSTLVAAHALLGQPTPARATIVTFDMVDVAKWPGAPGTSLVVTTGAQIPSGINNTPAANEFNISYIEFDIDGDNHPFSDLRVRTATFAGGQLVFDGLHHTEPATSADGSYVVTKGENSYLNMPFLDGEVIGDGLEEFTRDQFGAPGPPENNTFSVGLDEGGAVRWFQEGIDNFVGFRLAGGAYGWIRVQFDATASTLTFLDGAYDTSGLPIVAGSTTPIPGTADFDNDSDIDGADFLLWQRGLGITGTAIPGDGDANGDFNVNATDLAFWKAQFAGAAVGAVSAVPEPTAAGLLVCAAGLLWRRRTS